MNNPSSSDSENENSDPGRHQPRENAQAQEGGGRGGFRIPRHEKRNGKWTAEQIENFRKNWPHLRNFDISILENASLSELTAMAKQKLSNSKLLSQTMAANYEQVANFPVRVEAGSDDCTGIVHRARFFRGFVGDAQKLWQQARDDIGLDGYDPIGNYEVVSMGLGDLLTPKVWAEVHKPNSRELSIRMLSKGSVELAWRGAEKAEPLKDFDNLLDFKKATATLEAAIHRVMTWNYSFKL